MWILVISISSYLDFLILRIQSINIDLKIDQENMQVKKQFFVSKFQVQWIFRRVLLIDKNVNLKKQITHSWQKREHVNGH